MSDAPNPGAPQGEPGSTPPGSPGPAPQGSPTPQGSPAKPVTSRKEAFQAIHREERSALAQRAIDEPLSPKWGPRCLRCGELAQEATHCPRCAVELRSPEAAAFVVPRGGALKEVLRGVAYLPRGMFKLVRSPSLWPIAAVPLLLNILVVALTFVLAWFFVLPWLEHYDSLAELSDWNGWLWGTLKYVVVGLSNIGAYAAPILLPLLSTWLIVCPPFKLAYVIMFMPAMEYLGEATERRILTIADTKQLSLAEFWHNLVLGILDAICLAVVQIVLLVCLLPLHFIVVIGSVLWMVVPNAISAAIDYTDLNLVRRRYATRAKIQLWKAHSWRFFGYGLSFFMFLTIPLLNVVVVPAAAVGGTLLYLELDRK